ncbi:MAG: hypothetical protein CG446_6, partial [Methanosaeta sp. ASO1]
ISKKSHKHGQFDLLRIDDSGASPQGSSRYFMKDPNPPGKTTDTFIDSNQDSSPGNAMVRRSTKSMTFSPAPASLRFLMQSGQEVTI